MHYSCRMACAHIAMCHSLSIPQCEEVLRLLKVETGFLDNDGHFDEFVNPRFAG